VTAGCAARTGRRQHRLGVFERRRDRLLDEHVLAGLERGAGQPGVLGHAGQDHHEVDVRMRAHGDVVGQVGRQVEPLGRGAALLWIGVVDGCDLDAALPPQALDQVHVGRPEDAPAADHAKADAHVALLAVS
jgi:hypothetical protein